MHNKRVSSNPFAGDSAVDQAALAGFRAALRGKTRMPSRYAMDDLLSAAWQIGQRRGHEAK
ncbi:hypothetical protein [Noviherbaspirillum galbum]|uniref:Uncharacterized protein n=1 Tax=Noviherbaspirillum galbum TaxID=2709383 RepID=A0A6B3SR71_9BURK|nr:hypothetical protein [Noviherbaspirillum galbum]NEX60159.1 hypothetical protein [Noviherbaspirillum galbum]